MASNIQKMHWPTGYMTQNARQIYRKIVENIQYPDVTELYDYWAIPVDVEATIDELLIDIANYLDREGVVIGD